MVPAFRPGGRAEGDPIFLIAAARTGLGSCSLPQRQARPERRQSPRFALPRSTGSWRELVAAEVLVRL